MTCLIGLAYLLKKEFLIIWFAKKALIFKHQIYREFVSINGKATVFVHLSFIIRKKNQGACNCTLHEKVPISKK